MDKHHDCYRYTIVHLPTGILYHGGRAGNNVQPLEDTKYMGNSRHYLFSKKAIKKNPSKYKKIIEKSYPRIQELQMWDDEAKFISHIIDNPKWANLRSIKGNRQTDRDISGNKNPMFGRTGSKSPHWGKSGELNPMWGKTHSPEECKRISIRVKKYWENNPSSEKEWKPVSAEAKKKQSDKLKGRSRPQKKPIPFYGIYTFTAPNGTVHVVQYDLKEFREKHKLHNIRRYANTGKKYKGWTITHTPRPANEIYRNGKVILV